MRRRLPRQGGQTEIRVNAQTVLLGGVDPGSSDEKYLQVTGSPRDEPEYIPTRGIDPLQVVDEEEERLPVGYFCQEFQCGEADFVEGWFVLRGTESTVERLLVQC